MANTFSTEAALTNSTPVKYPNADAVGGRLRRYRNTIDLASQASGDTITLTSIPAGSVFAFGVITSSVSLGAATLAIGDGTTADLYKDAGTFTTADAPTFFGNEAAVGAEDGLDANTSPVITIGAAALPSSGQLIVDVYFSNV